MYAHTVRLVSTLVCQRKPKMKISLCKSETTVQTVIWMIIVAIAQTKHANMAAAALKNRAGQTVLISVRIIDHLVWMSDEAVRLLVSPDEQPP